MHAAGKRKDRRCRSWGSGAMSRRSDELYGLSLGTQTVGYGAAQVMEMRARMIHPRFAHSASFLEEGIRFLCELIFAPLFSEENLEEAKRVPLAGQYAGIQRFSDGAADPRDPRDARGRRRRCRAHVRQRIGGVCAEPG